ncbi:hypothetical protein [Actinomadura chokoriensis]|uniref:hypothetical protein n=1 Tax=Actinomadura chokoriensis TaxID=454156 RepID=UPI0031F9E12E
MLGEVAGRASGMVAENFPIAGAVAVGCESGNWLENAVVMLGPGLFQASYFSAFAQLAGVS